MQSLRWFLVGIALTAFSADYIRMKAQWAKMEHVALQSEVVVAKSQATATECLIELATTRATVETWELKTRLITTARVEALNTIDRAKDGDAEAVASLQAMGYSILQPGKRLIQVRYGMGGP
jgi:hypothetical protein